MSHKAGTTFFKQKHEWSKRKDLVLEYYLKPYLTKIATLNRPILIVDGFAGPGSFEDGEDGSPRIIQNRVSEIRVVRPGTSIKLLLVEEHSELSTRLLATCGQFPGTTIKNSRFLEAMPYITEAATSHSVFLYLDPYTVDGLEWESLDRLFDLASKEGSSVEILLNFNVDSFGRRGCAALNIEPPSSADSDEDVADPIQEPTREKLNQIVGGEWWQPILQQRGNYSERLRTITDKFCMQLRTRFNEVCTQEIKKKWHHSVPKYVLVFASRHPDTRELMNDAMVASLQMQAEYEKPAEPMLIDLRPENLVPELSKLPAIILESAKNKMSRKKLIWNILETNFGLYKSGDIKRVMNELCKSKQIMTDHHNCRLNDDALVWRSA